MSVYNPSGSGNVHIEKAISGTKKTGVVPPLKTGVKSVAKKATTKVVKKAAKKKGK